VRRLARVRGVLRDLIACALLFGSISPRVQAHSASDAYLTLMADRSAQGSRTVIHGQWDIALRDLDFVLKLDDDGDGRLTWREVRRHRGAIERYAYQFLNFGGAGNACAIKPDRQMIDEHADGAYAVLMFDVVCAGTPKQISLNYSLFFLIDPSHRGIFVMTRGTDVATALLSPANTKIDLSF
jgi:hypothetical protein